ncbi:MAG: nitrite reductase small subunit NirD [Acidobacteria bacterium]|nr:nitrite reductase small subunit NirD [Acidobacteriota bacterium]
MTEYRWVRIASSDSIPLREGRAVHVADREIALFNLGDRFLAVDNACPHRGGPLADGIVAGASVVCPLHAWKIGLETGSVERPAAGCSSSLATYPVRVEGGTIVLGLPIDLVVVAAQRSEGAAA